ncbi:hypothetical protein LUZ61_010495 [Rhynchospora tenuis]|uniref:Phospholipase D n=1 Tax=Rhynchospora tenuis TaxID=198213 RepID=A0AAD5ZZB6_9POAL|nr:hypothetical protein LUZ61_010495 [Rhynchospora tenuis]
MAFSHGDKILLHGDLDLHIISARDLPNRDLFSEGLRGCFASCVPHPSTSKTPPALSDDEGHQNQQRHHHHDHNHHHKGITSDPYVKVQVAGATVARTSVIHNCDEPHWDEHFRIPLAHCASMLEFVIKDEDIFGAQIIGKATVPASSVISGEPFDKWLDVIDPSGHPEGLKPQVHIAFKFTPVDDNPDYKDGIAGDRLSRGVEDAYFPLRKGGQVTLYQDAHVRDGDLPEILLDEGRVFTHEKCWEDICDAILEARHLIYIVGWSIYTKVKLVREPTRPLPEAGLSTLGDLLKYKSEEGVRVCLLVWDDRTSNETLMLNMRGLMQTHDEETRKFFKHSTVICVLSPRYPSSKLSIMKQQVVGSFYTHHQKCLILDTAAHEGNRKITAFIGGLDLCDGRYDTPQHRLFLDLHTVYEGDIHNPTLNAPNDGPRQPWHDLHCKIEGPAAYDVLCNFEQRWRKATKLRRLLHWFSKSSVWRDDALIKIDRISWILSPSASTTNLHGDPHSWVSREEDPENWHVQIFRSIDSGSIKGVPEFSHRAETKSYKLVRGKHLIIDQSIHTAYVKAIRSAKHFIYIENQYFIGSSYGWPSKHTGADNLIPMELALKIVEKIRKKERFSVYIVIPMWPEGKPTDAAMQEILFWQGQTIMMMYAIIGRELSSSGREHERPQHYLNFYCLGNRELSSNSKSGNSTSENNSAAASARKHKRFMIYVHAKGMIVDDEYVIIGSANINQRSLEGSRDTEIAMGAYQPHHTWARNNGHPHGQVYGYRKSLWAEHLGSLDSAVLEEPQSLECVDYVNKIADDNWARYTTEQNIPLRGHLLKYPINVEPNGTVGSLPGHETFPDVGGKVLGDNGPLPDELTM